MNITCKYGKNLNSYPITFKTSSIFTEVEFSVDES